MKASPSPLIFNAECAAGQLKCDPSAKDMFFSLFTGRLHRLIVPQEFGLCSPVPGEFSEIPVILSIDNLPALTYPTGNAAGA